MPVEMPNSPQFSPIKELNAGDFYFAIIRGEKLLFMAAELHDGPGALRVGTIGTTTDACPEVFYRTAFSELSGTVQTLARVQLLFEGPANLRVPVPGMCGDGAIAIGAEGDPWLALMPRNSGGRPYCNLRTGLPGTPGDNRHWYPNWSLQIPQEEDGEPAILFRHTAA